MCDEPEAPGIMYIAVAELPRTFERITECIHAVLRAHAHTLHVRVVVDLSRVSSGEHLPSVGYLTALADALRPAMDAAAGTLCAVIVSSRPLLWRARLFE